MRDAPGRGNVVEETVKDIGDLLQESAQRWQATQGHGWAAHAPEGQCVCGCTGGHAAGRCPGERPDAGLRQAARLRSEGAAKGFRRVRAQRRLGGVAKSPSRVSAIGSLRRSARTATNDGGGAGTCRAEKED